MRLDINVPFQTEDAAECDRVIKNGEHVHLIYNGVELISKDIRKAEQHMTAQNSFNYPTVHHSKSSVVSGYNKSV